MTACERARQLSAYYDGELPEDEQNAMRQHLLECPFCRQELRVLKATSGFLREGAKIPVPERLRARLHKPGRYVREVVVLRVARRLTAMAAAVLLVAGVWLSQTTAGSASGTVLLQDWERAAVAPSLDWAEQTAEEELLAHWIVADLSWENGSE
jgi:anti-sigma factor RsiW